MNYGVPFKSEKQKSKTIFTEGESWDEMTLGILTDKTQLTNIDSTYSELFGQSYPTKQDVGAEKIQSQIHQSKGSLSREVGNESFIQVVLKNQRN